uniref:Uncharacterized protein n=1 Tax=Cacopsylla melanoneura TaxID=428564 RepID=A0A8D8WWB5_9HEMI
MVCSVLSSSFCLSEMVLSPPVCLSSSLEELLSSLPLSEICPSLLSSLGLSKLPTHGSGGLVKSSNVLSDTKLPCFFKLVTHGVDFVIVLPLVFAWSSSIRFTHSGCL